MSKRTEDPPTEKPRKVQAPSRAKARKGPAEPAASGWGVREEPGRYRIFSGTAQAAIGPTGPSRAGNLFRLLASADPVAEIRKGYEVGYIEELVGALAVPQRTVLDLLGVSPATLSRRRKGERLTPEESDRAYRLTKVISRAVELFEGDPQAAREWLTEPARALGGDTPLSRLDTEAGCDQVLDLIGRLEHGVFT